MPPLDDVRRWFSDLGYDLSLERDGDTVWATLVSKADPAFVVRRYGSGGDETEAALSAKRRWEVEQIGGSQEGQPRHLP